MRRTQLLKAWHRVLEMATNEREVAVHDINVTNLNTNRDIDKLKLRPSDLQRVRRKWGVPVNLGGYGRKDKCGGIEAWVKENKFNTAAKLTFDRNQLESESKDSSEVSISV